MDSSARGTHLDGKKELVARVSASLGLTRLLETRSANPSLLILNHHRIGNAQQTPYDSGLFSATTADFDWQVGFLKQRFDMLTLPQALDFVHGRSKLSKPSVLLTFDDGYLDNYEEAVPVLVKHNVSATFFLVTNYVGTGIIPWWDMIAWIVKRSPRTSITLNYPETRTFDLPANRAQAVIDILRFYKQPIVTDMERFISELETACDSPSPQRFLPLLLELG